MIADVLRRQADHLDQLYAAREARRQHRALGLVGPVAPSRPETTAAVAWGCLLAVLAIREFVALYTAMAGDTLSETVWWMLGIPYGWRWVVLGAVLSALCTWMLLHFMWRQIRALAWWVTWRGLLALLGGYLLFQLAAAIAARRA